MTRAGAAGAAVVLGLGFFACYLIMVATARGQAADLVLFRVIFGLVPAGWPSALVTAFARAAVIVLMAGVAVILGVAAVGRHAWGALAGAVLTVALSLPLGVWLRNDVLVRPAFTPETFPQNSLPSTHAVAAAALVAAVLLLWPGRPPWWLPNAAGVVLLLVAVGNVVSQAHRPSDVVASFLLVGAVASVVRALVGPPAGAVSRRRRRRSSGTPR